jgi:hypothetical protein
MKKATQRVLKILNDAGVRTQGNLIHVDDADKAFAAITKAAEDEGQCVTVYCNKEVSDKLLEDIEYDYRTNAYGWDVARVDDKSFNLYYDTKTPLDQIHKKITDVLSKHLTPAGIEVEELAP